MDMKNNPAVVYKREFDMYLFYSTIQIERDLLHTKRGIHIYTALSVSLCLSLSLSLALSLSLSVCVCVCVWVYDWVRLL